MKKNKLDRAIDTILDAGVVVVIVLIWAAIASGCGVRVKGEEKHKVEGEATVNVNVTVKVDITPCEALEPDAKAACIETLIETAKEIAQGLPQQQGIGGI